MPPESSVRRIAAIGAGRLVAAAARLRGGGTALPGAVMQRIDPAVVKEALGSLPFGVVVVSGTNGKTTTTKIVVELLRRRGFRVFTNPSGSNLTQGIASELLGALEWRGGLHADIAVLELDEGYAATFARAVPPRAALILNVFRDQLDRFGELDSVTGKLRELVASTNGPVVLNRDDGRVARLEDVAADARFFGIDPTLDATFPSDDEMYGKARTRAGSAETQLDVTLVDLPQPGRAVIAIGAVRHEVDLQLPGAHNALNAVAALALVRAVSGTAHGTEGDLRALSRIEPASGRGEQFHGPHGSVELLLVKNPAGFRMLLQEAAPSDTTMVVINNHPADGKDASWLWDVVVDGLSGVAVASGTRAHQLALRLQYAGIPPQRVIPDPDRALREFLGAPATGRRRIYCSYTAMRAVRPQLVAWEQRYARLRP
ncbi:Mur ligase family protein [Curtobacterium ammoniigenes]|uniref:Mur ligase family protein n=1 Tax=Curtobacterium ammoniigenes TaxID=395387 RepID=UPI00083620E4|nr:Mur ligase family protein [Curtobacterium ammoniigenes]